MVFTLPVFREDGERKYADRVRQHCQTRSTAYPYKSKKEVNAMSNQQHRTCIRMSTKEYELLKRKSHNAGLSTNAWLMRQLEQNRPTLFRMEETREAIDFMNQAGRQINAIARDFNSGYGTAAQLQSCIQLLGEVYSTLCALRERGYPYAV